MRVIAKAACAFLLGASTQFSPLSAQDSASCCEPSACDGGCDSLCHDLSTDCGVEVYGWLNAGIIGNADSPTSRFNGPYNAVDRSNEGMMNQLYLVLEKGLPECGHGVGMRVDYLYGEDYYLAESIGMEKRPDGSSRWNPEYYGSAIPQAYVSLGNQNLSLQFGHFYSVVGYEGLMAPDNFFYSKSYSYQFAGPFTHWGSQLNWNPNEAWTVNLGLHNGWDALDREEDNVGFIGKVRYDSMSTGCWSSFAITTGDEFNDSAGVALNPGVTNRTRYSFLVGLPLTCNLDYVFHHWLGSQEEGAADGSDAVWVGIDQYLTYSLSDQASLGARFEWFRDEDGTRVGLNRPSNPNVPPFVGDFYSLSLGLNYAPTCNLVVRPEIRSDWFDGSNGLPFNDGTKDNQFMFGFDVILRI